MSISICLFHSFVECLLSALPFFNIVFCSNGKGKNVQKNKWFRVEYIEIIPHKILLHIVVEVNHKHDNDSSYHQHKLLSMVSIRSTHPSRQHQILKNEIERNFLSVRNACIESQKNIYKQRRYNEMNILKYSAC